MKKIILKIYLKTLYLLGIEFMDLDFYENINIMQKEYRQRFRNALKNDADISEIINIIKDMKYDVDISFIQELLVINDKLVKKYCINHNIEYTILEKQILRIGITNIKYKIKSYICHLFENIRMIYPINIYFEYKHTTEFIRNDIDDILLGKDICGLGICSIMRGDEYLEEYYDKYLNKRLKELNIKYKYVYSFEYQRKLSL